MIDFLEQALEAHTSQDSLDQPLPLLRPSAWALLLGLLILCATILIWSILGRLPVRIHGRGVLLFPEALVPVQSLISGPLQQILVREGQCVRAGQILARIDQVQLSGMIDSDQQRLRNLRRQHQLANLQAQDERALAAAERQRLAPYRGSGSIAKEAFVDKERQLWRLDRQQQAQAQQRLQAIEEVGLALVRQRAEYQRTSVVVAPVAGCLVEQLVQPGAVVNPGTPLFTLDRQDRRRQLVSLAYFPSQDGKRLKPGQMVRITPNTTRSQRHGGIRGRILSLSTLPVSREALRQRLGRETLVASVQPPGSGGNEPLIEAVTSLERNPRTFSGFDWGGGPGPELILSPGTSTEVSVMVEYRQPISYVIPLLRQISGIY